MLSESNVMLSEAKHLLSVRPGKKQIPHSRQRAAGFGMTSIPSFSAP
jgi:hypothetical protein